MMSNSMSRVAHGEICFEGKAVSRGVGIGKVVRIYNRRRHFHRAKLSDDQINKELRRFRAAVRLAERQLKKLAEQESAKAQTGIFEAQLLILQDKGFLSKIEDLIHSEKVNAEWAVRETANNYISLYKEFKNEVLRERYVDIDDVAERLVSILSRRVSLIEPISEVILVTDELKPSIVVELAKDKLKAIVSESGGWTSHAFIIARELGIPAVTGLKNVLRYVSGGEQAIVDGYSGQVIFSPSSETLQRFHEKHENAIEIKVKKEIILDPDLKTLDGRHINIMVNLDFPESYAKAKKYGARGVGLYRSEFLFGKNEGFPTEIDQYKAYRKLVDMVGDDGIKIRTFDLNLDGFGEKSYEKNPALGLRAIRLSLTYENVFRSQVRALLRASFGRKVDIVLPMISDVSEILRAKEIISQETDKLVKQGVKIGSPLIGVMIEVPSAIFMIGEILDEVDFINLGTNDLVQYLLAVDRDSELVSDWFRTLHPAVIRAIDNVLRKAEEREVPVIICGEMAGSPVYAPILVGLGAVNLSMNVNAILRVRLALANIAYEEAVNVAKKVSAAKSADEAEEITRQEFSQKWVHLFPSETFLRK